MSHHKTTFSFSKTIIVLLIFVISFSCKKTDNQDNNSSTIYAPEFSSDDTVYVLKANETHTLIHLNVREHYKYYYTLDDSYPTLNSFQYNPDSAIELNLGRHTVKAISQIGEDISNVSQRVFNITTIVPVQVEGIVSKSNYIKPVTIKLKNAIEPMKYDAFLNNSPVDIVNGFTVSEPYFYNLKIVSTLKNESRTDSFLFVILNPAYAETEWGLHSWTPAAFELNEITTETIETIYPKNFVTGINLPIILKTVENGTIKPLYVKMSNSVNTEVQHIKRGIGSYNILCNSEVSQIDISCGNKNVPINVNFINPVWTSLNGEIKTKEIAANSWIKITDNVTLLKDDTLTINEGTIILVDQSKNINNNGRIVIKGTASNPVVITCSLPESDWGGFISKGAGNEMELSNVIMCQSGYNTSSDYNWGHAGRQALFYLEETKFTASDCYILDNIGQVFYPVKANMTLKNSLIQRAKTGGQLNESQILIDNCIFTDFPDESYTFQDLDNDAIYISMCDATIKNSTFMFAKDDGLDAGNGSNSSGGDEGVINIENCWIEATFHEGLALSSHDSRIQNITNTTVTNCGQGIELGFSVATHVVNVDKCNVFKNGIGIRYGDNYTNEVAGTMNIKNSTLRDNIDHDTWNMVRSIWSPKLNNLIFTNTTASKPCEQYPFLYTSTSIPTIRLK